MGLLILGALQASPEPAQAQTRARPAGAPDASAALIAKAAPNRPSEKMLRHYEEKRQANENVVSIAGSGIQTGYSRYAEEIRNVLDDDQNGGLRIVPILGKGGAQNILDIIYLKGVDMGFAEQDVLLYLKKKNPLLYSNLQERVHYITKFSNSEWHLLARDDVQGYADLKGKKVNCLKKFSSTHIACETIFEILGVPVEITNFPAETALKKLKDGEIAAYAQIAGAPLPAVASVKPQDKLHFVPLDRKSIGGAEFDKLRTIYLPARLKSEHYPGLIAAGESAPTLANSIILAAYAWPQDSKQYQRMTKFVNRFFDNIDNFKKEPNHPKWREINLAAVVPGWKRFGPAQAWLDAHKTSAPNRLPEIRTVQERQEFEKFLKDYEKVGGGRSLSSEQKAALFAQFSNWLADRRAQENPPAKETPPPAQQPVPQPSQPPQPGGRQ